MILLLSNSATTKVVDLKETPIREYAQEQTSLQHAMSK